MKYKDYTLKGSCQVDFDTEIRFICATSKVDGDDLIRFNITKVEDEAENKRLFTCALKILRTMRKNRNIQFFVTDEGFARSITEAEYIKNMYSDFIEDNPNVNCASIYVKI